MPDPRYRDLTGRLVPLDLWTELEAAYQQYLARQKSEGQAVALSEWGFALRLWLVGLKVFYHDGLPRRIL